MITVSLCEIKPLYLRSKYVKVTLQEGQLKQIENILLDSALGGFLVLYMAKSNMMLKLIYIRLNIRFLSYKEEL